MDTDIIKPRSHVRLDISRDTELLNQFVRINVDDEDENAKLHDGNEKDEDVKAKEITVKGKLQKSVEKEVRKVTTSMGKGKIRAKQQHIERDAKKLRSTGKPRRRRRGHRPTRHEELYTDKDRAAAVSTGTKDIKHSLKEKRQQDRSQALQIPVEAEPGTFLALGNHEMARGELTIAKDFINKALELNPTEKNALVARSKCYILLGQPANGLQDAESALAIDGTFVRAIYQKAESLYYLGDFEHSLMYYHRGHRLRPDHRGFVQGIQKSQKAIENAIGAKFPGRLTAKHSATATTTTTTAVTAATSSGGRSVTSTSTLPLATQRREEGDGISNGGESPDRSAIPRTATVSIISGKSPQRDSGSTRTRTVSGRTRTQSQHRARSGRRPPSRLLRELGVDKEYLDNLLTNPNLKCKYKEDDDNIIDSIQETVDYLNSRQEFWRQQLPPNLK